MRAGTSATVAAALVGSGALACGSPGPGATPALSNHAIGVHAIDWRNTTYELTLLEGEGPTKFRLVDGVWESGTTDDDTYQSVRLGQVVFGDLTGDGIDDVAIESAFDDSHLAFDRLDVFTDGPVGPRWLGVVRGGRLDDDGITSVRIDGGTLGVLRAHLDEGSWEYWAWDGAFFAQQP